MKVRINLSCTFDLSYADQQKFEEKLRNVVGRMIRDGGVDDIQFDMCDNLEMDAVATSQEERGL